MILDSTTLGLIGNRRLQLLQFTGEAFISLIRTDRESVGRKETQKCAEGNTLLSYFYKFPAVSVLFYRHLDPAIKK